MSDLHLEFGPMSTTGKGGDVLILAGDILVAEHLARGPDSPYQRQVGIYDDFFEWAFQAYKNVIMVMGNHEHYRGDFEKSADLIQARWPTLHLLDNEHIDIGGQRFYGGTLWTDMAHGNPLSMMQVEQGMNDFKLIKYKYRRFHPRNAIEQHLKFLENLRACYEPGMIVISHHAPSYQSVSQQYRGDPLNAGYASDLDHIIITGKIKAWVHGHMHATSDYMIGSTRICANPRGYAGENKDFQKEFII